MPVELESLNLQLPLLCELLALCFEPVRVVRCLAPKTQLALKLLLLELLIFEALLKLQRVESACVLRREIGRAAAYALLQLKVERVLLLLELELSMLGDSVGCTRGRAVECRYSAHDVEEWA